jgi:hypothetical protein
MGRLSKFHEMVYHTPTFQSCNGVFLFQVAHLLTNLLAAVTVTGEMALRLTDKKK